MTTTHKRAARCRAIDAPHCAQAILSQLCSAVCDGTARQASFQATHGLLAALPLTTRDLDLAAFRLANARRYYTEGHLGAAAHELGLAEKSLTRIP